MAKVQRHRGRKKEIDYKCQTIDIGYLSRFYFGAMHIEGRTVRYKTKITSINKNRTCLSFFTTDVSIRLMLTIEAAIKKKICMSLIGLII